MASFKSLDSIVQELSRDCIYKNYSLMEQIMSKFLQYLGTNVRFAGKNDKTYACDSFQATLICWGCVSEEGAQKAANIVDQFAAPGLSEQQKIELFRNSIWVWDDEESFSIYDHFMILCFSLGLPVHVREGVTRKRIELDISTLNSIKYDKYHMDIERGELKYFLDIRNLPLPHSLYGDAQITTQFIYERLSKHGWDYTLTLDDIRKFHRLDKNDGTIEATVLQKMLQDDTKNYFFCHCSLWYIKFNGNLFTSQNRDGWRYIYFLIKHKNETHSAADLSDNFSHLLSIKSLPSNININFSKAEDYPDAPPNIAENAQEMMDYKYINDIQKEINSLILKARTSPDQEERASIKKSIASLKNTLHSGIIPGQGSKSFAADRDKKRKRVSKVIKDAIDSIGPDFKEIRDHLREKIHTGSEMYYSSHAEEWITDVPTQ